MELHFICPDCRCAHAQPAEARLGHLIVCLDCWSGNGDDVDLDAGVIAAIRGDELAA